MPGDSSQRSIVRRLAASVSFFTIALVVAGAVRLLAVPFIVHAISPSVYGTFATLPLFSYGGSSVVTMLVGLGLLMNVSMQN